MEKKKQPSCQSFFQMKRLVLSIALCWTSNAAEKMGPLDYREVGGVVYEVSQVQRLRTTEALASRYGINRQTSAARVLPNWEFINGRVIQVLPNGLLLSGGNSPVLLRNHPSQSVITEADRVSVAAMRIGRYTYRNAFGASATIPEYDFGKPVDPPGRGVSQLKRMAESQDPDEPERRVVEFQKKRAAEGSVEAAFELGKRYLEGRGVDKDADQARRYLQQAAAGDHKEAKALLASMPK
ncbi:MAG: tetratricopeptide repeat protein [Verrucomicrobiia bacterium]